MVTEYLVKPTNGTATNARYVSSLGHEDKREHRHSSAASHIFRANTASGTLSGLSGSFYRIVLIEPEQLATDTYQVPRHTEERFVKLAKRWSEDTLFTSSVMEMISHPAYREIIGMGWSAVPLILNSLRKSPDPWFWALTSITGDSPEPPGSEGDFDLMAEAWIEWGRKRQLIH